MRYSRFSACKYYHCAVLSLPPGPASPHAFAPPSAWTWTDVDTVLLASKSISPRDRYVRCRPSAPQPSTLSTASLASSVSDEKPGWQDYHSSCRLLSFLSLFTTVARQPVPSSSSKGKNPLGAFLTCWARRFRRARTSDVPLTDPDRPACLNKGQLKNDIVLPACHLVRHSNYE